MSHVDLHTAIKRTAAISVRITELTDRVVNGDGGSKEAVLVGNPPPSPPEPPPTLTRVLGHGSSDLHLHIDTALEKLEKLEQILFSDAGLDGPDYPQTASEIPLG